MSATTSRWSSARADLTDGVISGRYGLGSSDNPIFPGMHDASALVAGATLAAARAIWEGKADHGVNIAGGLHHAMADHASGFCIYNDPAIAIQWLLNQGAERIAYVDINVHHGDGVQAAFYNDPRVLDDQPARASGYPLPRHRTPVGDRWS